MKLENQQLISNLTSEVNAMKVENQQLKSSLTSEVSKVTSEVNAVKLDIQQLKVIVGDLTSTVNAINNSINNNNNNNNNNNMPPPLPPRDYLEDEDEDDERMILIRKIFSGFKKELVDLLINELDVDVESLQYVDDADLQDIGINKALNRKAILKKIAKYFQTQNN